MSGHLNGVPLMPKLELLIGMIASGKSTYAKKRGSEGALIICFDDLTQMLHGEYRYEPALRDSYRSMMYQIAWEGIHAGRDVVIDRTHLTADSRRYWVAAARGWMVPIVAVVFPRDDVAEMHSARRFLSDARGRPLEEWDRVARHHMNQADAEPLDWESESFSGCVDYVPEEVR
jgi:predicted kinase